MEAAQFFRRCASGADQVRRLVWQATRLRNPRRGLSFQSLEVDIAPVKTPRRLGSLDGSLHRPEGIAFSGNNELVVSNSEDRQSFATYRVTNEGGLPEFDHAVVDPTLSYVHGIYALENLVVLAARNSHCIAAFERDGIGRYTKR